MNVFVCADLHLSHKGIVKFLRDDGSKERPFNTTQEMDEVIISNWNKVVKPNDMVFVLGDAVINRSALPLLGRLQGRKQLCLGNHDCFRTEEYLQYFENVRGSWSLDNFILTHIPVHPSEIGRWIGNIHGHLHSKRVMLSCGYDWSDEEVFIQDKHYLCVSMEHINYTPISWEDCKKRFEEQQ